MKYQQWSVSLGFSTGYRWITFLGNLGLNGGIRTAFVYNSYDEALYRPFDPVLRNHNKGFVPALSLWSSLTLDKRDIYYDPSNGYYFTERFGIYGLLPRNSIGEWIEREYYLQTDTKTEYFFTLFDLPITEKWSFKSVFGIHTGLSFILPQYGRPDGLGQRPVVEQANLLSIDGMFIGRGWSDETRLATRGEALWENWAELRFPLVPGMLSWDFIFDAASWAKTPQIFFTQTPGELLNSMYFSFGGGLRISIPQFPFRFLFTKGFRVIDGEFQWKRGLLGGTDNPASGIDFVLSISISTY
jgi:outer membrane protein insertion porin family